MAQSVEISNESATLLKESIGGRSSIQETFTKQQNYVTKLEGYKSRLENERYVLDIAEGIHDYILEYNYHIE